jgi:hypothetical protein
MSEIEKALKSKEEDFHINNEERLVLIDVLAFVAGALDTNKIWFNSKSQNPYFSKFCKEMAARFANMPVQKEH